MEINKTKKSFGGLAKKLLVGTAFLLPFLFSPKLNAQSEKIYRVELSPIERIYLAARTKGDKIPNELKEEVRKLSRYFKQVKGKSIPPSQLLDGKVDNYEFKGLELDEKDAFNVKVNIKYLDNRGQEHTISYEPDYKNAPSKMLLNSRVQEMRKDIRNATNLVDKLNSDKNLKKEILYTLDVIEGKIPERIISTFPPFCSSLGFNSNVELRKVLNKTYKISVEYSPHSSFPSGEDFYIKFFDEKGNLITSRSANEHGFKLLFYN